VRYKYEVVSFPFIPDGTILNENIIDRKMLCANSETYGYNDTNPPCEGWGWDNYNDEITGTYPISRNIMHKSEGEMGEAYFFNNGNYKLVTDKHQLASIYFKQDGQIAGTGGCNTDNVGSHGIILPHTVIKHTIYFKPSNCSIEDSISWVYDNTRGRMRNYPFTSNASGAGGKAPYDVQFRPLIILGDGLGGICAHNLSCENSWDHETNVMSNEPWIGSIISGGTINYVAPPANNPDCNSYYPTGLDTYYDPTQYYHLPPYALIDAPLLDNTGMAYASYEIVNDDIEEYFHQIQNLPVPEEHHYVINRPFDVTSINPSDKTIYNPSEVDIDLIDSQAEQVFPTGYKFLTVQGAFPSRNVYADAEASGMFPNLVDYPAPSTLGPQSSIYRVKSGSTLRIEPCVTIMDALIDVEDGATLIYCPEYTFGNYSINFVNSTDVVEFCPEELAHCAMRCKQLNIYDHPGELVVDENEVWESSINPSSTISFANTLRIQSGNTLTLGQDLQLLFGPLGKIVVEAGAKLIINGAYLGSACDEMWKGIEVLGNPNLSQTNPGNQGEVLITNGGTIEHALVGVSLGILNANGTPNLNTTGGFVRGFSGATFLNCRQAVRAFDYQGPGSAINRTLFNNTTFEITEELPLGIVPNFQVQLRGVYGVVFTNSKFLNSRSDDFSVHQAGSGIASAYSGYKVFNCEFENLFNAIKVKSLGFDNISVKNSTFNLNLKGIELRYSGLAAITGNTFLVPSTNEIDFGGNPAQEPYGIYLIGSTGYEVEENIFYANEIHENVGIAIRNSGNYSNKIENNYFHTLEAAIVAMKDNRFDPAEGASNFEGLQFLCNEFGDEQNILNYSIALTDEGEVSMFQGVLGGNGAGNTFYPVCPFGTTDREFYVEETTPIISPVSYVPFAQDFTRPDCNTQTMVGVNLSDIEFEPPIHCPSNISSDGSISVFRESFKTNKSILNTLKEVYQGTADGGDTEYLLVLINESSISSFDLRNELLASSPDLTDRVMIEAIERDPAMNPWHISQVLLANSPLPQSVINVLERSDIDPYYQELVKDGQNGGMSNTTIKQMELAHFFGLMDGARLDYIRLAHSNDSTQAWNDSIIHYLSTNITTPNLQILFSFHLAQKQFQQAEDLLEDAQSYGWSQDYTDVMQVLLAALQDSIGADNVIRTNQTMLQAIASGDDRDAHLAQTVLEAFDRGNYDQPIVLPDPQPKILKQRNKKTSKSSLASVHPNPAKDQIYLNWKLPNDMNPEKVMLSVYNIQGKLVLSNTLNQQVGILEINVNNLNTGLYLYQLRYEHILLHSEKFEVLR
jgi:hypothetical protein